MGELIAGASASLRDVAFTEPVPAPTEWPGYQLSRARTLVALRPLVRDGQPTASGASDAVISDDEQSEFVELEIVDEKLQLIGRIDRIEHGPGGTRIVDLKAGWSQEFTVTRPAAQAAAPLRPSVARADRRVADESSDSTCRRPVVGEIDVNIDEAQSVVANAIALRDRFNDHIPRGWNEAATPSEDAFAHCDFKACCPTFMSEAESSWSVRGSMSRFVLKFGDDPTSTRPWQYRTPVRWSG